MELNKGDKVYYARIIESSNIFDVLDLTIRTVQDDWFVGIEKRDQQAFLFRKSDIEVNVFLDRELALVKVLNAEENKKVTKTTEYYEED